MKPYGMTLMDTMDEDRADCALHGRPTRMSGNLRSLTKGKRAAARRRHKRRARAEGRREIAETIG